MLKGKRAFVLVPKLESFEAIAAELAAASIQVTKLASHVTTAT